MKGDKEPMLPTSGGPVKTLGGAFAGFQVTLLLVLPVYLGLAIAGYLQGPAWAMPAILAPLGAFLAVGACIWFGFRNSFQIWALQRPNNLLSRTFLPGLEVLEGMLDISSYYEGLRTAWGPNFCSAGMVCLGEWKAIEQALTQPQARATNLGAHPLIKANLPKGLDGRKLFLLCLSSKGAGGAGAHEAYRACMAEYVFTADIKKRRTDATAKRLLAGLATDYKEMKHGYAEEFWTSKEKGLTPFLVRYMHYAIFGMDLSDEADVTALVDFNSGEKNLGYYLMPIGYVVNKSATVDKLTKIYEKMPCFDNFKEGNAAWNNMTKRDAALLMLTIMRVAGIQGTHLACMITMGGCHLPAYAGRGTYDVDVTKTWDTLNFGVAAELRDYVLEVMRLAAPVTTSHRVAAEDFDVDIKGKKYQFPRGTKILIPMSMGMTDTSVWGDDAFEIKLGRPKLWENFMGFNSVGDRTNGRMCPGTDIALDALCDVVRELGEARRARP